MESTPSVIQAETAKFIASQPIRFVTAASLFDGHDAAINIMRRVLQSAGAEVIHLGHNRSVLEIVDTAIQEDVQGIAISSYQGGHMEYFKYMVDLLRERGAGHIKIFGGGGGVIVSHEIEELHAYGVTRIFSPEDGLKMGLRGMIDWMMEQCNFSITPLSYHQNESDPKGIARSISLIEASSPSGDGAGRIKQKAPTVGITGTGGAGKSTLTDELVRRFVTDFDTISIAILSVDPTKKSTGGALLGDRIRMNSIYDVAENRVYMRSFATRQANKATSAALRESISVCQTAGFDLIILETAGIGQSDTEITDMTDLSIYVMTGEFGAPTQLEKIGMLDVADLVALNKFEKRGSEDALRDVRKQMQRNRMEFHASTDDMPVYPTMASHFNDEGVTNLYLALVEKLNSQTGFNRTSTKYSSKHTLESSQNSEALIPAKRQRYLGDISDTCRQYRNHAEEQIEIGRKWGQVKGALAQIEEWAPEDRDELETRLSKMANRWWDRLSVTSRAVIEGWDLLAEAYRKNEYSYTVRGKKFTVPLYTESLSGTKIPRVALPRTQDPGEQLRFALLENLPGFFPYTSGVFPFKRVGEDPTRMFAGEGSPERTNRRFHLVSENTPAKRLSTAFDSVTLYGFDPHERPDIYGKVGNAGVSICTLDDMKKLYSGFDLCNPSTSVSMTINGPAPMLLAMFLNTAVDQQIEQHYRDAGTWEAVSGDIAKRLGADRPVYSPTGPTGPETELPRSHNGLGLGLLGTHGAQLVKWKLLKEEVYQSIRLETLKVVRGTVQADILKEDQAQNTCIFSTEFALRMMGDVQQYFINQSIPNFYSVSISGYHIAEAGANPISQLAFTLSNGFTFVEYYLARGMDINDFAPNLSFFFSNGMDPEYSVIGRVARRIWSIAMRDRYGANDRSQMLKYHIQTSGRSLHAQEIQFNDIRTTLQALMAIYDNCNSLHTNAYDEAITTPTEESVRRAIAIQLIINRELGLAMNENPLQGSYVIDELTDLVEAAVLVEFDRINDRGGVLGAMETMYQRSKIQEESLFYERKKLSGELPIIGVNTFLVEKDASAPVGGPVELMRSTEEEKERQIGNLRAFQKRNPSEGETVLEHLKSVARSGENTFEALMEAVAVCSLGDITHALFEVGGQYRRSM